MNIGFSGTKSGMSEYQKKQLRKILSALFDIGARTFHHGDCVGADAEAHETAKDLGYYIVVHPPRNPKHRAFCVGDTIQDERGYLTRNANIVDMSAIVIVAPQQDFEIPRSDPWATVSYARSSRTPVILLKRREKY